MSELNLFIIWKNAVYKKDEILSDIKSKFEILNIYNITWSDKKYSENLSRFYGVKLPSGCEKEKHCGKGSFLLVIVKDNNPVYGYRQTTAGIEYVNTNMFDSKALYRKWTGGGHKVHGTNSLVETNHDLTLLLGKNAKDYLSENKSNNLSIININKDLIGSKGFLSVEEMFYTLNNTVEYAILRNYECLPEEIYINEHNDIDLICNSKENIAYVLNAKKYEKDENYRVRYYVIVNGKKANFDIRSVGDNYYDKDLEKNILKNRILNDKGFYTLRQEDYFYTLLYHAILHKQSFSDEYKKKLMKLNKLYTVDICNNIQKSVKFLEKWMIDNEYIVVKPLDLTVGINLENIKYASKLIYKTDYEELFLKEKNIDLQMKNLDLTNELNYIKNSRTWKYTKIIRQINSRLKNKVKSK